MDQQLSPGQLLARGAEADRLLAGPIFKEAFDEARAKFIDEWERAESTDRREYAHAKVTALTEVQRQLRRIVSQGEYASLSADR